jgi:hypothetical protein
MSEKMWEPIGGAPLSGTEALRDSSNQCKEHARKVLGEQKFEAARERGRQLTFDAGVAYALGEKILSCAR